MTVISFLSLCPEAEQSSSPSRTGVGSDHEDSQAATMGNEKHLTLQKNICLCNLVNSGRFTWLQFMLSWTVHV